MVGSIRRKILGFVERRTTTKKQMPRRMFSSMNNESWGTICRARHMTDKGDAKPVFRETLIKTCLSSPAEYKFDTSKPDRLLAQTRISILTWNRPRRGTLGAIESHVAGNWHVIASQEASEYLQHENLANRFHAGCAVLFNKDTFYPDVRLSSVYIHDTEKLAAASCKGR